MARRIYQAGSVYQAGRSKQDRWLADAPAYGRFWKDVPGDRQRLTVSLGICRTRTIAQRKCQQYIQSLGVDSDQQIKQTISTLTFRAQGEIYLDELANGRNALQQTTISTRRYALDKWIYPAIGDMHLADVNARTLKELVESMAASLAPSSIRDYSNIVKDVVASALDENGEERYPRKWNAKYIDAPAITAQRRPSTNCTGISDIVLFATGQYRMLYALLAGCGPMRAGEALGLEIGKHISEDFRTLTIAQKAKRGEIQPWLKTTAGNRKIDLSKPLANMLREFVGERKTGLLFATSTGRQLLQSNTLQDSLHPILNYLALEYGGFNIFRRFRITLLRTAGCPDFLQFFWSGHAQQTVADRNYLHLEDREWRLMWAEKIGLGFELPGELNGQHGLLLHFPKTRDRVAS